MKAFRALVLNTVAVAILPVAVMGQRRAPAPISPRPVTQAPVTAGALGGSFLSPGFSRPLGGITPARTPIIRGSTYKGQRYVGPVYYVPNAFDTYAAADPGSDEIRAARRAAASVASSTGAPVIVNQYFGSNEGDYARSEFSSSSARHSSPEAPSAAGDPIGPQGSYYLIAYKDHSVYSALAYWVEDGTLHYVTTQNTHNQASLGLIDVAQTTKLNADRSVPFSISR